MWVDWENLMCDWETQNKVYTQDVLLLLFFCDAKFARKFKPILHVLLCTMNPL